MVIDLFIPNLTIVEQNHSIRHLQTLVSDLTMQAEVLKDSKVSLGRSRLSILSLLTTQYRIIYTSRVLPWI